MGIEQASNTYATHATGTYAGYEGYCQYRLPCGYCKELGRQCPYSSTTTITWESKPLNVNYCDNATDNNYLHDINKVEC